MKRILKSAAFYPITGLYVGGVGIAVLVVNEAVNFWTGALLFLALAIIALLFATWTELKKVHKLVDGQRHELIARIDELTGLLIQAGVVVPPSGEKEADARDDVRRGTAV